MGFKYPSVQERIIANSYVSSDSAYGGTYCWIWMGKVSKNRSGMLYGMINVYCRKTKKTITKRAHRLSIETFKDVYLTPNDVGQHLCNNTLCVNPEHLSPGSQSDNMKQCIAEGRHYNNRR